MDAGHGIEYMPVLLKQSRTQLLGCEELVAFQEQKVRVSEMRHKPLLEGLLIQCSVKTP